MDRVKSRDFLLSICGVLFLLISIITIVISVIKGIGNISESVYRKKVLNNLYIKNSSVKLYGFGNFYENGPNYKDLVLSDYKVKFKNYGDSVLYTLKLCNDNDVDVDVDGFISSELHCYFLDGTSKGCQNVLIDNYILDGSKKISDGELKAKSCYKLVVNAKYEGDMLDDEMLVSIDRFDLVIDIKK